MTELNLLILGVISVPVLLLFIAIKFIKPSSIGPGGINSSFETEIRLRNLENQNNYLFPPVTIDDSLKDCENKYCSCKDNLNGHSSGTLLNGKDLIICNTCKKPCISPEEKYREIFHDLSEIQRQYWKENDLKKYPRFRPGFRGYVARELLKKGYSK